MTDAGKLAARSSEERQGLERREEPHELHNEERNVREGPRLREVQKDTQGATVGESDSHYAMDSDDGDVTEDDATMGFIGPIVPDKDDFVANHCLSSSEV